MKDRKIALFMISPLTHGGGAEKYFINLAKNLNKMEGMKADIVTFDDQSFRRFARLLHIFTRGNIFGKITDYKRGMRECRENVEKDLEGAGWKEISRHKLGKIFSNYDVIYAKNELADLFTLKMIGYKNLPPIVVGVHTPIRYPINGSFFSKMHNFFYLSFVYKWLLNGTKFIHVSNSYAKKYAQKNFQSQCRLIYYPFSAEEISETARVNNLNLSFDISKKNIIFLGRLSEQKGIDTLIYIIEKIGKDDALRRKLFLNVFGSGDEKYEAKIKGLSRTYPFVRYFGHVENRYIPDILSKHDLMIAPSKWETLPYSILEAQALGVPVISFDTPGPADIIENNKTGILAKSSEALFEKLIDFIEGNTTFKRETIIANMKNKFDPKKIYPEVRRMFEDAVQVY